MVDAARAVAGVLRAGGWTSTGRLQLLDFDVAVHSDDPTVVDLVRALYEPLLVPGEASHVLAVGEAVVEGRAGFSVALDGVQVVRTTAPDVAFAHLLFEANRQTVESVAEEPLLHAAGVAADGVAVVLPGPMGAGKSTLAAGLAQRGLGYLTDEVVAIHPTRREVRPYPKPISLGDAPEGLRGLRWEPPSGAAAYLGASGVVPARAIRARVEAAAAPLGLVVLPRYEPGAPTETERLDGGDALAAVAAHAFHLDRPGALGALGACLEGVPCHRLVSGDLDGAVDAVLRLVAHGSPVPVA